MMLMLFRETSYKNYDLLITSALETKGVLLPACSCEQDNGLLIPNVTVKEYDAMTCMLGMQNRTATKTGRNYGL